MGSPHRIVRSRGPVTSGLSHAHARETRTHDRLARPPCLSPFPHHFLTCTQRHVSTARKGRRGPAAEGRRGDSKYRVEASCVCEGGRRREERRGRRKEGWRANSRNTLARTHGCVDARVYVCLLSRNASHSPTWRPACVGWKKGIRDQRTGNCPHSARWHRGWTDGRTNERPFVCMNICTNRRSIQESR